ncbi:MAG: hypothetical protein IKX40_05365, partial [Thermoguttaceae bacterium]|nr:hypothetical protein [Thermoguttaceae bacterium]
APVAAPKPAPSRAPVAAPKPSPSRGPVAAPSRGPVAPPSARPTPSRGPVAPPSVRPTPSRGPVTPPSVRPTPSRGPVAPPSVRPTPGPRPTPGHITPGPKPGPGHVTPGPKPGPGPSHIPSGGRPGWQTRPHDHFDNIYRDVHRAMYGPNVPPPPHAPRPYWNNWGVSVALGWTNFAISTGAFTFGWWDNMYYRAPWWNYYYYRSAYPVYYWWGTPTWNSIRGFYPTYNWTSPFYYDYGQNVVIGPDSYVYINNQRVTTQYEYAQSAAELASYGMPSTTANQTNLQWLPLGTFALSTSPTNPQASTKAAIQLAATNDGLISGSFYNRDTNQTFPIQGRVDPQTQRVAFYVIGAENTVFETGMYNLTQSQTPVMIHKNGGRTTQNALLVRLNPPQNASTTTAVPYVQNSTPYIQEDDNVALPIVEETEAESVVHSILD